MTESAEDWPPTNYHEWWREWGERLGWSLERDNGDLGGYFNDGNYFFEVTYSLRQAIDAALTAAVEAERENAKVFAEFFLDEFETDAAGVGDWTVQTGNDIEALYLAAKAIRARGET